MPNESDHDILLRIDERTRNLHVKLFGSEVSETADGRIPRLEARQDRHEAQINFWRGAIALMGFTLLVFGAILLMHLLNWH